MLLATLTVLCQPLHATGQQPQETDQARIARNAPAQAPFSEAIARRLRVPEGFRIDVWASGLGHPRMIEVAEDGTAYVTRRQEGDVLVLRDSDGDGRADQRSTFANNLSDVNGVALHNGWLYLASSMTIWRTPRERAAPQAVVSGLPDGGQHGNRMVRFGPDRLMYVSVGSSCNDCAEQNQLERATLQRFTPDGQNREFIANGLRNTIGFDWNPATGVLWGMDHGSDFRGDHTPPEELNRIEAGRNYGWPICYAERRVDEMTNSPPQRMALKPGQAEPIGVPLSRDDYCAQTEPSVQTTQAHAAPMAMRFYAGRSFPAPYRDDAYIAMHGSWNRSDLAGYKVTRLRFDRSGEPRGFEDFVTGFVDEQEAVVYGRPVGIAYTPDGAMLVTDDLNGAIYRIAYTGRRP
jgi:glucose/arabinose dehydrogenase